MQPILLPTPRRLTMTPGAFRLGRPIRLDPPAPAELLAAREALGRAFAAAGTDLLHHAPEAPASVDLRLDGSIEHPEGYRLEIAADVIRIRARAAAGAFYAAQTLRQLLETAADGALPCLLVEDHPDFPARGVMLDISRDKVPTMATLFDLVDRLAGWKINQLQLYTEHTFAYRNHAIVWQDASPMTAEEIRALDRYCAERFIELVPNQNSFGHMERWLKHPPYQDLSECPEGAEYWGRHNPPATLDPLDPRSLALVRELHDELLPNFTSRLFNVGCDETMELGMGRSRRICEERGRERVYLDFLLKIHEGVKRHGRQMMFWGDIIICKPELIGDLPNDIIALDWGYEAKHPFDEQCARFGASGVPFYVCPGTSSWLSLAGRTDNALENLRLAAECGLKRRAIGYLNTDWGDQGHLQYLSTSYLPLAYGAAASWCLERNPKERALEQAAVHAFGGQAELARAFFDLGNVYQLVGKTIGNSSLLFWMLVDTRRHVLADIRPENIDPAEAAIDEVARRAENCAPSLERDELMNTIAMLRLACARGRALPASLADADPGTAAAVRAEHRRLWLTRNRPGGLADSLGRLPQ